MKYGYILMSVMFALLTVSCNKENNITEDMPEGYAPVKVVVDDFAVSMEDFSGTRTDPSSVGSYNNVKALTLAFYTADGTEVYKATQLKGSMPEGKTFGEFNFSLPIDNYTMVVLGYGKEVDDPLELTSPTVAAYTGAHSRETLVKTQAVSIPNANPVHLSATLDRIIAKLEVNSSDTRTAGAKKVRMTMSGGSMGFNPTTGLATDNAGFSNTVGISAAVGATTKSVSYLFLASDKQTMNVTIDVLDADGAVLVSKTVNDVPFQRNRVTKLTGLLYTANGVTSSFTVNTDWLEDYNVTF